MQVILFKKKVHVEVVCFALKLSHAISAARAAEGGGWGGGGRYFGEGLLTRYMCLDTIFDPLTLFQPQFIRPTLLQILAFNFPQNYRK